jgi:LysM repeat protein
MTHKLNWIRALLTLMLSWQLLGLAAPAYADTVYTVQAGDTLYRISLRFGVNLQALMTANRLTTSIIYVGQQLVIPDPGAVVTPAPPSQAPAASAATVYVVLGGDTLNRIAIKFGVSPSALMAANGLSNANFLMVGQRLMIPTGNFVPAPAPAVSAEQTPTPPPPGSAPAEPAPASGDSTSTYVPYVVQPGDSLWRISHRFNISVDALKSINQLYNNYIYPGQQLIIPGPDATPEAPPTVDAWPPDTLPAWIPKISWRALDLYKRGILEGRNPNAFSVAGDCNSDHAIYLEPVATGVVNLGAYLYLQNDVSRFWGSLKRLSLAVHGGYNSRSVMDPTWANPQLCNAGEGPFACELRINNPSVVFIALGTGDQFTWRDFEKNYRKVIEYAISQNVLPVLVTKADKLEAQQGGAPLGFINDVIRRLGQEYDMPVMDLWLAVQDLPNGGLLWEGGQDFHLSSDGYTRHNIITLETLDVIWRR